MNSLIHNRIIVNVLLSCVISNALRKTKIETDSYKLLYLPEKGIFIKRFLNLFMGMHFPPPPSSSVRPPSSVRPNTHSTYSTRGNHHHHTPFSFTHSATTTTHFSFTNIAPMSDAMLRFEYSKHSCDATLFRIFEK
jgi:hypothetical protein